MAHILPYFKFIVAEWLLGRIAKETDATKGAFIDAIAHYWHKDCCLTVAELQSKLGAKRLQKLIALEYIVCTDNIVSIPFLAEQYTDLYQTKTKLSKAGKKGRDVQLGKTTEPAPNQPASPQQAQEPVQETTGNFIRVGIETFRMSASQYYKEYMKLQYEQWCMQNATDRNLADEAFKRMDKEYIGYDFSNQNHVQKAFQFVLKKVKDERSKSTFVGNTLEGSFYKNKKHNDGDV